MKRWQNIAVQLFASAGDLLALWGGIIPDKAKAYVIMSLATAQLVSGIVANSYNPDGTPASQPYRPPQQLPKTTQK